MTFNKGGDWKKGLAGDQIKAAEHIGKNALLLAGPGTGKTVTLTRKALALVMAHDIEPENILVLTFTRVAAYKLLTDIGDVLDPIGKGYPHVATLHSFALTQLLKNSGKINTLPKPLRIADDWEERNIIFENLKTDLKEYLQKTLPDIVQPIRKIRQLFNQLSADWETLKCEKDENQRMCRDPKFIGAWNEHRRTFGYTLRAEMVYRLKQALEQIGDFDLQDKYKYILVDEYQDLNPCDLAIVEELEKRGSELFVAGDDDQSIYGFRYADPLGIRVFEEKYGAGKYDLEICYRCDRDILKLAEYVADLDYDRMPKKTKPRDGAGRGIVKLLRFKDQASEAVWIARKCKEILSAAPGTGILILMRSDNKGKMSEPIKKEFEAAQVPYDVRTESTPLDSMEGRRVLSFLRLIHNPCDSLAWYTLLLQTPSVGTETLNKIRGIAKNESKSFYEALVEIQGRQENQFEKKVAGAYEIVIRVLKSLSEWIGTVKDRIKDINGYLVDDKNKCAPINEYLLRIAEESGAGTIEELLAAISTAIKKGEQEQVPDVVNIMTMHKAKGLSSDIVFLVAAEREFIPGDNIGSKAEDERRLLYVSLSRAKRELYITYCMKRTGTQKFLGSESGKLRRNLCPFLIDAGLKPETPTYA